MKFKSKYKTFHSWKCIWKYRLRNGGHFVQGEMSQSTLSCTQAHCAWGQNAELAMPLTLLPLMLHICMSTGSALLQAMDCCLFGTKPLTKPMTYCQSDHCVWADVILADFHRVISHYLQGISTYLSCTAQRVLRTIYMQKSEPKYACLPSKIVEVWIDRFCVRYDWWRRLQPMSSVSPVCWQHPATTWTNVDFSLVWFCRIHLRAISQ